MHSTVITIGVRTDAKCGYEISFWIDCMCENNAPEFQFLMSWLTQLKYQMSILSYQTKCMMHKRAKRENYKLQQSFSEIHKRDCEIVEPY